MNILNCYIYISDFDNWTKYNQNKPASSIMNPLDFFFFLGRLLYSSSSSES